MVEFEDRSTRLIDKEKNILSEIKSELLELKRQGKPLSYEALQNFAGTISLMLGNVGKRYGRKINHDELREISPDFKDIEILFAKLLDPNDRVFQTILRESSGEEEETPESALKNGRALYELIIREEEEKKLKKS